MTKDINIICPHCKSELEYDFGLSYNQFCKCKYIDFLGTRIYFGETSEDYQINMINDKHSKLYLYFDVDNNNYTAKTKENMIKSINNYKLLS